MNDTVPEFLENVLTAINDNRFNSVVDQMQGFLAQHPELIDMRARQEFLLLQKILEYKAAIQDWDELRILKQLYQRLQAEYATDEICGDTLYPETELPDASVIWWCWLQGMENAPPIVRRCYESLQKLGREIRIITEDNLGTYLELPEHIKRARSEGRISDAHFSDLIRIGLLASRGGCWIDATVLCTGTEQIGDILENSSLFCYRSVMRDGTSEFISYDSWFIYASHKSAILNDTKKMLYKYWEREERLAHYFLFHLFFTLATWRHPEECSKIPVFSTEPCHVMQLDMLKPWSETRFRQLCAMSDIHKLTYKYDTNLSLNGTIIDHLIKDDKI